MNESYKYFGDSTLYEVVVQIQKEKNAFTIQLFRAHTSEPYGELQIPRAHAERLSEALRSFATEDQGNT